MSAVFLKLLNMSITAGWLILAVILARLLLKKAPRWIVCLLWALAAVRLICPFSFQSVFSLIPSSETVPSDIALTRSPAIDSGIVVIDDAVNPVIADSFTPDPGSSANPLQIVIPLAAAIWIAGIACFLIYALLSWRKLKRTVSASVPLEGRIMACDDIETPFILGVFRPVVYVPSSMSGETLDQVIRHETAHLERRDHWWKTLGYLLLAVYWFHPLCWVAYILLCRDIEAACDEKVVRDMDKDGLAAYSQALLDCSLPRRRIAACPLAFGEVGVKERVRGVLNYKKPAFWIVAAAVVVCIALAVCLMTDPFSAKGLSDRLAVSMDMAIAEYNRSARTEDNFAVSDYEVLKVSKSAGRTTVYALVLYEEYGFDGVDVVLSSGSWCPAAITFDTSAGNNDASAYDVVEYWEPRDGGYYADDIREKFPLLIAVKALIASEADIEDEKLLQAAREYYGVEKKYWLTIGADGVKSIEVTAPYTSGGCENADGSLYRKGERIRLEPLDGLKDLRGVSICALAENGEVLWLTSIPDTSENKGFTRLGIDEWNITDLADTTENVIDLSGDGPVEHIFSEVYHGYEGGVPYVTNSERIRVTNKSDTDIVCLLYDTQYDEPIQTTEIKAGSTGEFSNLTRSREYQIGIEPVGEEIHISISD